MNWKLIGVLIALIIGIATLNIIMYAQSHSGWSPFRPVFKQKAAPAAPEKPSPEACGPNCGHDH